MLFEALVRSARVVPVLVLEVFETPFLTVVAFARPALLGFFDGLFAESCESGSLLGVIFLDIHTRSGVGEPFSALLALGVKRLFGLDSEALLAFLEFKLGELLRLDAKSCCAFQLTFFLFLQGSQCIECCLWSFCPGPS
jgi:hypothetical protein